MPIKYVISLSENLAMLCFTKDLNRFSFFIKRLIERLPRTEQKNFFYTFNGLNTITFLNFLRKFDVCGLYIRARGKIGGYVGDRTKTFLIRYGNYSRSKRLYKYSYNQVVSFTKPGAIGIDLMLVYIR